MEIFPTKIEPKTEDYSSEISREEYKVFTEPLAPIPTSENGTTSDDDATSVYILPDDHPPDPDKHPVKNKRRRRILPKDAYLCKLCGRDCLSSTQFRIHMRVHTGERPYHCTVAKCPKTFKRLGDRTRHLETVHNTEAKFRCGECSAAFTRKCVLTVHMRNHTGEKPHKCGVCGHGFVTQTILIRHLVLCKAGKLKFWCEICGRGLSRKGDLKAHLTLLHKGIKRTNQFQCVFCDARYPAQKELDNHVRQHVGEKPFICKDCGLECMLKHNLNMHRRYKHKSL